MRARRDYYLSGPCSVQSSWPCPYCFYIDVGESWLVEEILPKPQAIEVRRLRAVEAGVDKECVRPPSPHFRLVLLIIVKSPPERGRELSFREAVLPLMYCVREDGLQKSLRLPAHIQCWQLSRTPPHASTNISVLGQLGRALGANYEARPPSLLREPTRAQPLSLARAR
jgi:hypothetical protein